MGAGQPPLGTGQLNPGQHLLRGTVAAQLRLRGLSARGLSEFVDPGLEFGQRALERVEPLALDASSGPDREGPGGYRSSPAPAYLRLSIGT